MSTDERCAICRNVDRRRLIELGWNAKMNAAQIAACFGNIPSAAAILKHLNEHVDEGTYARVIPVSDAKPLRARALAIQEMQVAEIERRITMAQEKAAAMNDLNKDLPGYEPLDWSHFFDILDKDMQAAVSSILKAVGLQDKREMGKAQVGADIARIMLGAGGGLAPKRLSAGDDGPIEGEARDVTPDE